MVLASLETGREFELAWSILRSATAFRFWNRSSGELYSKSRFLPVQYAQGHLTSKRVEKIEGAGGRGS
jgi:hypothetical protein